MNICLENEPRKARKEHRCVECHWPIMPGDLYQRYRGISDGEPVTAKTCAACQELWDKVLERFTPSELPEGWQFETLFEYCDGELGDAYKAIIGQRSIDLQAKAAWVESLL